MSPRRRLFATATAVLALSTTALARPTPARAASPRECSNRALLLIYSFLEENCDGWGTADNIVCDGDGISFDFSCDAT